MRKSFPLIALVPCLLLAANASADTLDREGLYGFVGVGSHSVHLRAKHAAPENRNAQWRQSKIGFVSGAGYRLNDNFAVEAALQAQGGGSKANTPTQPGQVSLRSSSRAATFSALGILPVGDRIELFGRAGVGAMRTSLTVTGMDFEHKAKAGSFAMQYGLGADVRLGDRSFLRAEWNILRPTSKSESARALAGERVTASQINLVYGRRF